MGDSAQAQVYARKGLTIAQTLVQIDKKNAQALYDLTLAYASLGDSYRLVKPGTASVWYRESLSLTQNLAPLYGEVPRHWIAIRNEGLAEGTSWAGQGAGAAASPPPSKSVPQGVGKSQSTWTPSPDEIVLQTGRC